MAIVGFSVAMLIAPATGQAQDAQTGTSSAATAAKTQTPKTTKKRPPSAAQIALRERQKKCAAEWKQAKADGTVEKTMKWPQYWSACNKRLKATM